MTPIDQRAYKLTDGYEAACALAALHYQGILLNTTLDQFITTMPIAADHDPHHGFSGNLFAETPDACATILPKPLVEWLRRYTDDVVNLSGKTPLQLQAALVKATPIIIWAPLKFNWPEFRRYDWGIGIVNFHTVLLDGYAPEEGYHIVDPSNGTTYWISSEKFENSYNLRKYAVGIQA
ncbi:hypothetical protein IV38_GL000473 [Lactobacillus selangorensis]|uniref:Peptidase C39-like domain-containing protein n=1 Tax=Lactobacillus selangorensis TaxID=81857 RepID=A0A0R2FLY2_9LACO|nr:hypothetical protein IV38_GL000473 [Lactobacillus selangorensis]KRN33883.1 hypothetical protein IV40_GL000195 [Lactobacillus selangorensis]